MANDKSALVEIGGLWVHENKDGEKFMSGKLGRARLFLFRNKFKDEDRFPDFRLFVAPPTERKDTAESKEFFDEASRSDVDEKDDSDIPF